MKTEVKLPEGVDYDTLAREAMYGRASVLDLSVAQSRRLTIVPIGLKAARAYVAALHRHHPHTQVGHKFSIGVEDETGKLRGVAIAGRPVAKALDDGRRLEVLRVCTDGCPNACSALYGACARAGKGMGYLPENIFTYTLASENGTSLLAAGWVPRHRTKAEDWDRPSRARSKHGPTEEKDRWHAA